ncbi:NFX1-type zinc finger-containing protein 1 [Apiospora rasikravindrae]|uniref:NFX1-type zinc finger-containing protein 1 n=1 Tax=Apiospora rasikravindrae TaxID=990691 RepID=A0ABR1RQ00_9PEZI
MENKRPFLPTKLPKEPCPRWASTGECIYGDVCKYSHDAVAAALGFRDQQPPLAQVNTNASSRQHPTAQRAPNPRETRQQPSAPGDTTFLRRNPAGPSSAKSQNWRGQSSPGNHNPHNRQQPETRSNPNPQPRQPLTQGNANSRNPHESRNQDDLREWKRTIRQAASNRTARIRFFELAIKLVDGEVGISQDMFKTLAKEDALQVIRTLVQQALPQATSVQDKATLWVAEIEPLLRVITHQRVVDSAVLEQEVFTIYNFLHGIGGQRMKTLYDFIIEFIGSMSAGKAPVPQANLCCLSMTELSLGVLSKMLDSNSTNIVNQDFSAIIGRLEPLLNDAAQRPNQGLYLESQARQWLRYIKLRLGVGDSLPVSAPRSQSAGPLTHFVLPKNLPGHLSSNGPRHDNDHADIEKISILPTPDEILCVSDEYLPTNQPTSFHRPGIIGRLDREFRLLREDTVGQLRDVVRKQLEKMHNNPQALQFRSQHVRTFTYHEAEAIHLTFHRTRGLDLLVRFVQPARANDSSSREDWWMHSKRLQPGGLVCIICNDGSTIFCVVSDATKYRSGNGATTFSPKKASLADSPDYAYVHLLLADPKPSNTLDALHWYQSIGPSQERCLVEFPGVLLPSFQHTLEALQQMSKAPKIPFIDLIAPDQQLAGLVDVPPPHYATKPDFVFDLSSLTDGTPLQHGSDEPLDPELLSQHSTLDATQSAALVASLSMGLALIQGPPGTGKSYTGEKLIQVLLSNKKRAKLGPILCVCYTNHALDQLLEHLLDEGVEQVIRIGSRSKSERLSGFNLRTVSNNAERTRSENQSLRGLYSELDSHVGTLHEYLDQLDTCLSRDAIKSYLADNHPRYHTELSDVGVDDQGFQIVHHRPQERMEQWLHGGIVTDLAPRDISELLDTDLWTMTREERQILYYYWAHEIRDPIIDAFREDYESWESLRDERDRVAREVDLRCLTEAHVVGITTTGLAKNLDLLRRVPCKVLLCEEAGEVLEAHSLTALLPSIQHAILIGDNLQLKPQIQNFELNSANPRGAQYSLDVSMFERLVSPPHDDEQTLPYSTLQTQRRMHPSISELVRTTLYPNLEDGGHVVDYPEVCGMKKRLFWFNHTAPEDRALQLDPTSTSHVNSFEVEMTVALVQHLVRQGVYGPDDIAVITPYLGQLLNLRRRMKHLVEISLGDQDKEELDSLDVDDGELPSGINVKPPTASKQSLLKSVRLATVDNFQGEEAKVVIISLVRSNEEKRCGFLSTSNRINVLLSRAKHGMYIIGNSETYGNVRMWTQVIDILRNKGNIGNQLELECPRHPGSSLLVSEADHFLQHSPEGGCNLPCDERLPCGHACMYRCHSDMLHNAAKCLDPCPRPLKGCGHACPKICGDACPSNCQVKMEGLELKLRCGHVATGAVCWKRQHPESIECHVMVQRTVPGCKHTVMEACHVNVDSSMYRCPAICLAPQPCGHACTGQCCRCNTRLEGRVASQRHGVCTEPCNRRYAKCRHSCQEKCHGESSCPPCSAPCEVRCSHSVCSKKCHEPCEPCAEQKCASRFGHWYSCANNHLFTLGESSMQIEEAKCPQCGAAVDGVAHEPAKAVGDGDELEEATQGIADLEV